MNDTAALLESLSPYFLNILTALGVFILGWILSRWADRTIRNRLGNDKGLEASDTVRPLIATVVKYAIMLASLYAALDLAGIPASSLLAVFGAAGLAIALAVQGTLSNIAAGIMLIFLRSMKVGEYIETPNVAGTVLEIGLFTTQMRRGDGVFVSVPNAQIWGSQITNYSRFDKRRVDIDIELDRDNDLDAALKTVRKALAAQDMVVDSKSIEVALTSFTPTTAILQSRFWLPTSNLRDHTSSVNLALNKALRDKGFKLPKFVR